MSAFTAAEIAYLTGQRLGRLATLGADGAPHVVPVVYAYNAALDTIDIGGFRMGRSKKYRDAARDGRVAFVVDDAGAPGQPRGVEIRGTAAAIASGGKAARPEADEEFLRVTPRRIIAWGLDTDPYHPNSRAVNEG